MKTLITLLLTVVTLQAAAIDAVRTDAWTSPANPGLGTLTLTGDSPKLVLIRAQSGCGCTGTADPVLSLFTGDGKTLLATNDNWAVTPGVAASINAAIARASLPPLGAPSKDAILLVRLSPGTYSFKATGKAKTWERASVYAQVIDAEDLAPASPLTLLGIAQSARTQSKAPAMVVSRINNKSISSVTDGFIRSDSTTRAPINAFHNIGSCGKSITATLAGLLVDEGKIRWNSSLAEVFPDLASGMNTLVKAITLEQLLAHRGGFDGYLVASEIATLPTFTGTAKQQRLALVTHLTAQAPAFAIGDFRYSNAGYSIAGAMLEQVSGKAYEDLIRDRVMKPIGAEVIFGYPAAAAPKGRQTWGHIEFAGAQLVHEPADPIFAPYNFPVAFVPAGTFSMTIDGLARYVQMHLRALRGEPSLLKASIAQYLHRPFGGAATGYALGWEVRMVGGQRTSQHNGSLDPYLAQIAIQEQRNAASVVIASASDEATFNAVEQAAMLAIGYSIGSAIHPSLAGEVVAPEPGVLHGMTLRSGVSGDVPATLTFRLSGTENTKMLLRAVGPSLNQIGIITPSLTSKLVVRNEDTQALIALNNGWDSSPTNAWPLAQAAASVPTLPLRPRSADSAVIVSLPAGRYKLEATGDPLRCADIRLEAHAVNEDLPTDNNLALDASLESLRAKYESQAVAYAVTRGNNVIRAGASGLANVEEKLPATPDTGFLIASISKTITATAAMQLVEQGKIDLDADINVYMQFPIINPWQPKVKITCRQLLTHTSSISDAHYNTIAEGLYTTDADPTLSLPDLITQFFGTSGSLYSKNSFARTAPGTKWDYSNMGIALLGYIVERVALQPFDQYCTQRIFQPSGMTRTTGRLADAITRPLAMPYSLFDEPHGHYTFADYPDGGVFTTANDLSIFMRAIMAGGSFNGQRILNATTVTQMLTPSAIKVPLLPVVQGLGFYGRKLSDGRLVWGHTGGERGVLTSMFFHLETQTGIVCLMNKDTVASDILEAFSDTLMTWGTAQP